MSVAWRSENDDSNEIRRPSSELVQDTLARQTIALTNVLGFVVGGVLRGMPPPTAAEVKDLEKRRWMLFGLAFIVVLLVLTYRAMLLNPSGG
jgi:hypothetical protein